jgi:hypothetical protein
MEGRNSVIEIMTKLFQQARKSVSVLINVSCFNGLTPLRLSKFSSMGWKVAHIHICNVKKWFGRYYFVRFDRTQNRHEFITFDTNGY